MPINPIELKGNWDKGYAMDMHTISSVCIGHNEFGHPQYDTTRSDIGELVYQLKYKFRPETKHDIIKLINPFLENWDDMREIDIVIPAPPSNKNRRFQPVYLIAESIAECLKVFYTNELLEKINVNQAKNLSSEDKADLLSGSIKKCKSFKKKVNILIIDDLYDTGTTLNEVCTVLKKDKYVNKVFVLVMTKTRR